jgi:hypothetical protein
MKTIASLFSLAMQANCNAKKGTIPLCRIQCYGLVQTMMLIRIHQTVEWRNMLQCAILPVIEQFESDSLYANGNWDAIVNWKHRYGSQLTKEKVVICSSIDLGSG